MRKLFLSAATIATLALVSPLSAQNSGSWTASLGGGASFPTGDFGDFAKTGWNGAASLGYRPAKGNFEVVLDAGYNHFSAKGSTDSHDNIMTALARVNYRPGGNLYALLGAGIMRDEFHVKVAGVDQSSSNSAFAISGGLGYGFSKSLFLEGRVMDGFTDNGSTVYFPITLGFRF